MAKNEVKTLWTKNGYKQIAIEGNNTFKLIIPENAPTHEYYSDKYDFGGKINRDIFKSNLSSNAKLVYSVLCLVKYCSTCIIAAKQDTIAEYSGLSLKTTRNALRELEHNNVIQIASGSYKGLRKNWYYINKSSDWRLPNHDDEYDLDDDFFDHELAR